MVDMLEREHGEGERSVIVCDEKYIKQQGIDNCVIREKERRHLPIRVVWYFCRNFKKHKDVVALKYPGKCPKCGDELEQEVGIVL